MRLGLFVSIGLLAGGCSQSLPSLDGEPKQQVSVPATATAASSATTQGVSGASATLSSATNQPAPSLPAGPSQIVGFKTANVTFYSSETSFDGERHEASSIPVPLRTRGAASGSGRVEIATVSGPRWVDRAEIVLGPIETAAKR